jgi:hypothetical protein
MVSNSVEQSFCWDIYGCSASQERPLISQNPKVNYRVHGSKPLVHVGRHTNPKLTLTSCFFKIHFNISISSVSRSSKWPLPFRFPMHFSSLCPSYSPRWCHFNNIQWRTQSMKLIIMQFSPSVCYFLFGSKYSRYRSLLKGSRYVFFL